MTPPSQRIASIDILRAITMVLMIFVNDLWSLRDIPQWLLHVPADADGMGFSDVIFPAFLFIVGMSIPFAVSNRRKQGETRVEVFGHILMRSGALLIMGLFLVNGEYVNEEATGMHRLTWNVLVCTAFMLIWNNYPPSVKPRLVTVLKATGMLILAFLAFRYRAGEPGALHGFSTYWWGILGLIGWAYLVSGTVYIFSGGRFRAVIMAWLAFNLLCVVAHTLNVSNSFLNVILGPVNAGALPMLTTGGVLVSMIYLRFREERSAKLMLILATIAAVLFVLGISAHQYFPLSKIRATPPWILVCSAITIAAFMVVYWIADEKKKPHWFEFIKPAGTNTLLCYLIPHFAYAIVVVSGVDYPEFMLTGTVGLIKSFAFALLVIFIAGALEKRGIQLKL